MHRPLRVLPWMFPNIGPEPVPVMGVVHPASRVFSISPVGQQGRSAAISTAASTVPVVPVVVVLLPLTAPVEHLRSQQRAIYGVVLPWRSLQLLLPTLLSLSLMAVGGPPHQSPTPCLPVRLLASSPFCRPASRVTEPLPLPALGN